MCAFTPVNINITVIYSPSLHWAEKESLPLHRGGFLLDLHQTRIFIVVPLFYYPPVEPGDISTSKDTNKATPEATEVSGGCCNLCKIEIISLSYNVGVLCRFVSFEKVL